jgi:hypothetical protein
MVTFKDSHEANFRRMVRAAIRKGGFSKGERDVTLAIVNHWFHHKGGPKDYIYPGRAKIAKKAGVSIRTVASTLSMLRDVGALVPVSHLMGGGGTATRYRIDTVALMSFCGCDWVNEFFNGYYGGNCTVNGIEIARLRRAKIAHGLKSTSNVVSFKRRDGGEAR